MPVLEVEKQSSSEFHHLLRGSFMTVVYALRQGMLPSQLTRLPSFDEGEWKALLEAARKHVVKEVR